jgi:hypothetical protein
MDLFTASKEPGDTVDRQSMMRVVGLDAAQQDVGIDQNAHLPAGVIEAFAADGLVRKGRRVRQAFG